MTTDLPVIEADDFEYAPFAQEGGGTPATGNGSMGKWTVTFHFLRDRTAGVFALEELWAAKHVSQALRVVST